MRIARLFINVWLKTNWKNVLIEQLLGVVLMKRKNPVLEKARKEGFEAGFRVGFAEGEKSGENKGIKKTVLFVANRFANLHKVHGIGPKTLEKIRQHFGPEYFEQ
jgi:predicted transposase YdaD